MRIVRITYQTMGFNIPTSMMCFQTVAAVLLAAVALLPRICMGQNLLNGPQKIVIDAAHDRLLVSNYGNGALVQIDNNDNQSYFVQDAGFIDGMDIVGDTLYGVGSNRKFYAYNLDTEERVLDFTFPGAGAYYLSSVASDSAGHLFVSCPGLHTIYKFRISDQSYWVFAEGNGLNRPNGILLERENNRIVVIDDSAGSSLIHAISLSDSTVSTLTSTSLDRPDGIVRDVNGVYYIGGYYLPGLYRIDPDFSQSPEMFFAGSHMVYPTYDPSDHSILITYYGANSWERIMLDAGIGEQTTLMKSFHLSQNYPNPFSPATKIYYNIQDNSNVQIDVYSIGGQLIKALVRADQYGGDHAVIWNGDDEVGRKVASGLYFYRMSVNGEPAAMKRCLLLE